MSTDASKTSQPRDKRKADPRVGRVIADRFELVKPIGRGGFATVYKGIQLNLDQPVAIKILEIDDKDHEVFMERFLREARTAAKIRHPDIVTIIDYGSTEQDEPYIVLELLEGEPLDVALKKHGPMEPGRALRLMVRCLDALQAAHDQGVIHRDLKPGNLYVSGAGSMVESLKILDFGIARAVEAEGDEKLTVTGQLLGTPSFLPPEYIQSHHVTPALDVYQMGLILVQMLIGRSVVDGRNLYQSMMAHCTGALDIPPELLNSPLGAVVAKAVTRDLSLRFTNAGEFRDALIQIDPSTVPVHFTLTPRPDGVVMADTDSASVQQGGVTPITGPNSGTADLIAELASRQLPEPSGPFSHPAQPMNYSASISSQGIHHPVSEPISAPVGHNHTSSQPLTPQATVINPAPDQRQGVSQGMLLAVASLVFLGTLGIVLLAISMMIDRPNASDPKQGTTSAAVADGANGSGGNSATPSADKGQPGGGAAAAADPSSTPNAGAAATTATVDTAPTTKEDPPVQEVEVTAQPTDKAQIFKGEELLGTGTATVRFEGESPKPVTLTIRAKGFVEQTVEVGPGDTPQPIALAPAKVVNRNPGANRTGNAGKGKATTKTKTTTKTETTQPETTKKTPSMGIIDKNKPKNMGIVQ